MNETKLDKEYLAIPLIVETLRKSLYYLCTDLYNIRDHQFLDRSNGCTLPSPKDTGSNDKSSFYCVPELLLRNIVDGRGWQ